MKPSAILWKNVRKYSLCVVTALILMIALVGCGKTANAPSGNQAVSNVESELLVSSAPSLKASLTEIVALYAKQEPGVKLTFNYGPSGSLKSQIEQGAATDVFLAQSSLDMNELEEKGLLKSGTRINLLSDELVLIVGKANTSINSFEDLTKPEVKKIGIGETQTVPAARTAQETLTTLTLWDSLQSKLVVGKDLMQITSWVESGDADAGLVWDTIARTSDKVRVAAQASADSHKPVVLPGAVINSSKNIDKASSFLKFLQSDEAMKIFEKNGFRRAK